MKERGHECERVRGGIHGWVLREERKRKVIYIYYNLNIKINIIKIKMKERRKE